MSHDVAIVDLGVGNLGNVRRALAACGGAPRVTSDAGELAAARRIVLPGVGAFRPPRERLRGVLERALGAALDAGATLLGICVGYQLLFESGEEHGEMDGLALLPGRVTALPATVPLPQIGWNRLAPTRPHPLLEGVGGAPEVYFVHGYAPEGVPEAATLATALHGREFAAMAGRRRVAGMQFHPEKSGPAGLRLLSNFLRWEGAWS